MSIHRFILVIGSFFHLSYAEIREISTIEELYIPIIEVISQSKVPVMIFDIDNTLATTVEELGRAEWFYRTLQKQQAQPGCNKQEVLAHLIELYTHIHNHIPLKLVESTTGSLIETLQSDSIPCFALTARSLLIERTFQQLSPLGIDFTRTPLSQEDMILSNNPALPALYTRGIIFNGDNNKGETLLTYLRALGYTPDYVIYTDDSLSQVERVHKALEDAGIPCIACRYGYMDSDCNSFDMTKAEKQLNNFLKEHPFTPVIN